jgi:small subunit ribosomal protein S21
LSLFLLNPGWTTRAFGPYTFRFRKNSENHFCGPSRGGVHAEHVGEVFVVKLTLRDRESIQEAVRRFRKLVERSGIKKEMRRKEHYEKPSEIRRRAKLRAERRVRRPRI